MADATAVFVKGPMADGAGDSILNAVYAVQDTVPVSYCIFTLAYNDNFLSIHSYSSHFRRIFSLSTIHISQKTRLFSHHPFLLQIKRVYIAAVCLNGHFAGIVGDNSLKADTGVQVTCLLSYHPFMQSIEETFLQIHCHGTRVINSFLLVLLTLVIGREFSYQVLFNVDR